MAGKVQQIVVFSEAFNEEGYNRVTELLMKVWRCVFKWPGGTDGFQWISWDGL